MAIIDKPSDYFTPFLWTGDGATTNALTGVGFQPDLVWGKCRSNANENRWTDSVRGVTKEIYSDSSAAESTTANGLKAFGSDGFTVGDNSGWNGSSRTYVSWNWKAGTSFTNDASSTGIGTIDSAGSVNQDAGFSIVSYTGNSPNATTIKHGLNSIPQMIIFKRLVGAGNWATYHQVTGNTKALSLNTTATPDTSAGYFNNATPTSSVFSVANSGDTNSNGNAMIAYCFSEKQGYSKFGSYVGNGNADGAFIYTGFKPAFVMLKNTTRAASWLMYDNKRLGYNVDNNELVANTTAVEETYDQIDILSNGFKMRANGTSTNLNGDTYIYMAFAENPFVASNFNAATAR